MIPPTDNASNASFVTTWWPLLYATREGFEPTEADKQFAQLLSIHWRPITLFISAHGHRDSEARDMARRFIVSLVDRRRDATAGPWSDSLRPNVLSELKSFLGDEFRARIEERLRTRP